METTDSGDPPTRKRKSKFDVPPADSSQVAQAKAIAALLSASSSDASGVSDSQSLSSHSFSLLNGEPDANVCGNGLSVANYQRDEVYYARLDRAREKNINYVKRKDLERLEREAKEGDKEPNILFPTISRIPKQPRGNANIKTGLGGVLPSSKRQQQKQAGENTSVFVSGLSPDLTEKDLETLFSVNGKIKRIKMYTFPDGKKKGEALVTFTKVEAVALACLQYNDVNIGGDFTLKVSRAEFKANREQQGQRDDDASEKRSKSSNDPDSEEQSILQALPADSQAFMYPVVLIQNVFDAQKFYEMGTDFFTELEADMLEACCACGHVRRLLTPSHSQLLGCVAVTFDSIEGARECFSRLHNRKFDNRQLSLRILNPPPPSSSHLASPQEHDVYSSTQSTLSNMHIPDNEIPTEDVVSTKEAEEAAQDTEDFLNSLL